jgi:membrane protease YdiL (CAAX protease family)
VIETKNLILPPTRCGKAATIVILVTVALHASRILLPFLEIPRYALSIFTGISILLLVLALIFRNPMAIHITLFTLLGTLWFWERIWPPNWPFHSLVPLIVYLTIVATISPLRRTLGWLRLGKFDRSVRWLVLFTVLISSLGLLLWFILLGPDISQWLATVPSWNPIMLILGGLVFAIVNAAIEESIYRGIIMQALDAALGAGILSLIIQAILFGLIHINGVPGGWLGVIMAMIYGLILGFIRRRAQGMLAPFIAHVVADAVIFCMLVLWVR